VPKPTPATTPSRTPEPASDEDAERGSRATSQMAGTAARMPSHTRVEGRSPVTRPTTMGTSAAPTADTGATTPIRPEESPR
jgi:hypothetical protein